MANPAKHLLLILEPWLVVPQGQTPEAFRSDPDWSRHRLAVQHLVEIERFLVGMNASGQVAEEFLEALPAWTAAVFAVSTPWGTQVNGGRHTIDQRDLRMLRMLSTLMDTAGYTPALPPGSLEQIVRSVNSADELIRMSNAIDIGAKRYLLGLVAEAKSVMQDIDTYGEVGARRVLFELGGAMTTVAGNVPDPERSKWKDRAADLLRQLMLFAGKTAIEYGKQQVGLPPG